MNQQEDEEPIFSKIDKEIKDRAQRYVTESKISGNDKTNSLKKLIELSLTNYMDDNQLE